MAKTKVMPLGERIRQPHVQIDLGPFEEQNQSAEVKIEKSLQDQKKQEVPAMEEQVQPEKVDPNPKNNEEDKETAGPVMDAENDSEDSNSIPPIKNYLDDDWLPINTRVTYCCDKTGNTITCSVIQHLSSGSYGKTYLVRDALGGVRILKECCLQDCRRFEDLSLDFSGHNPETVQKAMTAFENEPDRIRGNMEKHLPKSTVVNDNMTLDEAKAAARKQYPNGCLFTWKGDMYDSYTALQRENMNIALPHTPVFSCFGNLYYVMDKAEGVTLKDFMLTLQGEKNLDVFMKIMEQLCVAVENIHRLGCIHQDITPSNVIVHLDEKGNVKLKVIDFGLAANLDKTKKDAAKNGNFGSLLPNGTLGFSDAATNLHYRQDLERVHLLDIYALGTILYYMVFFEHTSIWNLDALNRFMTQISQIHNPNKENFLPFEITGGESSAERQKKIKFNACYKLVKNATCANLVNRIQSAVQFKDEIRELMTYIKWIGDNNVTFESGMPMLTMKFECNAPWEVIQTEQSKSWLAINEMKGSTGGEKTLVLSAIEKNTTDTQKRAIIRVKCGILEITGHIYQLPDEVKVEKPEVVEEEMSAESKREKKDNPAKEPSQNDMPPKEGNDSDEGKEIQEEGRGDELKPEVKEEQVQEEKKEDEKKIIPPPPIKETEDTVRIPAKSTKIMVDNGMEVREIRFKSNKAWKIKTRPENIDWWTVSQSEGSAGSVCITLNIKKNPTEEERSGMLLILSGNSVLRFDVIQKGYKPWYKRLGLWGK